MDAPAAKFARPASVEDLKLLLRALAEHGVDYLLVGGYALYALGYQRGTIDILLRPSRGQGVRARAALLVLPEGVARDLDPDWFVDGETIRVADEFVVDLMFSACGETYDSLLPFATTIDLDGVPVRTLGIEGLLKTKRTVREKDRLDCEILERAIDEWKKSPPSGRS